VTLWVQAARPPAAVVSIAEVVGREDDRAQMRHEGLVKLDAIQQYTGSIVPV
jgi:hypothetical protein